jgi:phosphoadenosine phosphosulfate reductase
MNAVLTAEPDALERLNAQFPALTAEERVRRALTELPGRHVLSSSFGAQAAVMLHLVTRISPDIPVILLDTGYLFPETCRFVDELSLRLALNLKVYRPQASPAWQESRWGKLWEQGLEGIERYTSIKWNRCSARSRNSASAPGCRGYVGRSQRAGPALRRSNCATAATGCTHYSTGRTATSEAT